MYPVTYKLRKEEVLMRLLVWPVKQLTTSDELLWSISGMLTGRGKPKYAYAGDVFATLSHVECPGIDHRSGEREDASLKTTDN
jgi:hypothetical protein